MKTIRLRTSRRALYSHLRSLPKEITGRRTESELNKVFTNHLAYELFGKVEKSFLAKSNGGTDELGDKWLPLPQETIANRPVSNEEYRRAAVRPGERGILTVFQNKIWKGVFANTYKRLRVELDEGRAKQQAGITAWAVIKALGGKTKLNAFGKRKVPILRVSDRLYRSVSQGSLSGNRYYPPKEQVFEVDQGTITMGTDVPYAGNVSRLRPVLPPAYKVVRAGWVKQAIRRATKGLVDSLENYLRNRLR